MFMRSLSAWPAVALLSGAALAKNSFVNPPTDGAFHEYASNQQYSVGDTMHIRWDTEVTTGVGLAVNFPLKHETTNTITILNLTKNTTRQNYDWVINLDGLGGAQDDLDSDGVAVMYLALWNADGGPYFAKSHYFNITARAPSPSSSAPSSTPVSSSSPKSTGSSPASSGTTASQTSASAATTSTPGAAPGGGSSSNGNGNGNNNNNNGNGASSSPSPDSSSSSGPSGAVIGGAVGGTVGGLAVVGALAFLLFRHRRKSQADAAAAAGDVGEGGAPNTPGAHSQVPDGNSPQVSEAYSSVDGGAAAGGYYSPQKDSPDEQKYHYGVPLTTPPPQWRPEQKVEQVAELDTVQPQELYSPPPNHDQ